MNINEIQSGTKLELSIYNIMGEIIKKNLVSELEWVEEQGTAVIAAPVSEGVIFPVRVGAYIDVYFENNSSYFTFKAKLIHRGLKDNIALLRIEARSEITRIQRRQFFRFECLVNVAYRVLEPANDEESDKIRYINTYTKDLSGGGIRMVTDERLEKNSIVECILSLGNEKTVKFKGKIIRSTKIDLDWLNKFDNSITFHEIENKDREQIIRFIFAEQRRLRKKGLI